MFARVSAARERVASVVESLQRAKFRARMRVNAAKPRFSIDEEIAMLTTTILLMFGSATSGVEGLLVMSAVVAVCVAWLVQ